MHQLEADLDMLGLIELEMVEVEEAELAPVQDIAAIGVIEIVLVEKELVLAVVVLLNSVK